MKKLYRVHIRMLAVAVSAMSIAALGGGIGAAGAQAQSTEVLTGTATKISGSAYGNCLYRYSIAAGVNFSAVGSATSTGANGAPGPYSGTFTETNANANLSGTRNPPWKVGLHIPFFITSGNTTITGTIVSSTYPATGTFDAGFLCSGSVPVGFSLGSGPYYYPSPKYTATIQSPGQPAQAISGNATIHGNFYIQNPAQTTFTETLAFP
jgi:hypothetical protein